MRGKEIVSPLPLTAISLLPDLANKQRSIILAVARASEEMDDTRSPTPSRKGHAERRGAVTSQVCTIL